MTDDSEATLGDAMDFIAEQAEKESDKFEGTPPKHGAVLVNLRAAELLGTLNNIREHRAHEGYDNPTDEDIANALEEDVVDLILAIGALKYEYDLDIAGAFSERRELMEAVEDADSEEEVMEALLGEDAIEAMGQPEPGDDVSRDDYDGTAERGVQ